MAIIYLLTSFFGIGHYFIVSGDSRFWLAVFYNNFAPFMFLIGPFLYCYVKKTLDYRPIQFKKDWMHFIPASIALIGNIPYLFQPFEKKLQIADQIIENREAIRKIDVNLFYTMSEGFVLRTITILIYLFYCFYLLWKLYPSKINEERETRKQSTSTYRWLVVLLTSLFFILLSFIVLGFRSVSPKQNKVIDDDSFLYLIAGCAYCIMSLSLIIFPEILYGVSRKKILKPSKKKKEIIQINPGEDPFLEMSNTIQKYLQQQKPYLNYDFSISTIALDLKIQENHVSYCIKHLMNTNFTKLKTKLRIKNALELLQRGSNSLLTIEAIGKQSGFRTRSHFYAAFKKEMGITPSEYLQNLNQ